MMKAQFMSLWDGLITDLKKTVIVMGATNRPKDMDTAILRRMASKFYVPAPDHHQRMHILNLTLRNESLAPDFDLPKLAELTEGFSGSDLKEVARCAAVACLADDFALGRQSDNLISRSNPNIPSSSDWVQPNSWLQIFNPFRSFSSGASEAEAVDGVEVGTVGDNTLALRAISMKDFESAVRKAKQSRAHCAAPVALRRVELD